MRTFGSWRLILAASLLAAGCAQCQQGDCPTKCSPCGSIGRCIRTLCGKCSCMKCPCGGDCLQAAPACGEPCECCPAQCCVEKCCLDCCKRCPVFTRPDPGPPPVRYRPEMPPKFLPVPTEPMLSPVRPDAPEPWRGDVEVHYDKRLTFPGRD